MPTPKNPVTQLRNMAIVLLALCANAHAATPNRAALDAAVNTGNFGGRFSKISTLLAQKVPADSARISADALTALLNDPAFVNTLDQRELLAKVGVANVETFARAAPNNKTFLAWLLPNTEAMDLYLEGATPSGAKKRLEDKWTIPIASLEIWNKIRMADPDAHAGMYQRLAIATALAPPGSGNHGAGMAKTPADPVERYQHFKAANVNHELFASFNHLTVWEYQQVVSSCASDADLAWARQMLRTWRPDLLLHQQVVNSTSEVKYGTSPFPYTDYPAVLAGGGKCGPRSSWAVMICQAFGIPAIGVLQPGHACVAYKALDPAQQPQPGNMWKVAYGRGWEFSRLDGLAGPEFVADVALRSRVVEFSQAQHLRWLAAALSSTPQAAAVMKVVEVLESPTSATPAALAAPEKSDEAEKEVTAAAKLQVAATPVAHGLVVTQPGTIHSAAESCSKNSGVCVYDCFAGGKQINFQKNMKSSWVEYKLDVPAAGTYGLALRVAAPNPDQVMDVSCADTKLVTVSIPNTRGLWDTTPPVEIKLDKGPQTLRLSAAYQRGVAVRWFELKFIK